MKNGGLPLACCLMVVLLPAAAGAQAEQAAPAVSRLKPDLPLSRGKILKLSSGELYALAEFYLRKMREVQSDLEQTVAASKAGRARCVEEYLSRVKPRLVKGERWRKKIWRAIRYLDRGKAVRLFTRLAHTYQRVLAEGEISRLCGDRGPVAPDHIAVSPDEETRMDDDWGPYVPDRVPVMPAAHTDTIMARGQGFGFTPSRSLPGGQALLLHLGGAMEQGFDSNPLICADDRDCSGAGYGRFVAHLDLRSPPLDSAHSYVSRRYTLRLRGSAAHRQYFASAAATRARPQEVEAEADLQLEFHLHETLSVALSDRLARTTLRWRSEPAPRTVNRAGLYLMWIPGGEAVELTGSYTFGLELLQGPAGESADRFFHEAALTARWWFLNRTAVVLDAAVQVRDLGDEPAASSGLVFTHSTPLRLLAGLEGLITNRLHLTAQAGYGNGFYEQGDSFGGALARVEASWILGSLRDQSSVTRIHLGYERGFADNYFSNFEARHEVRAGFERFPRSGFQLYLLARFRHLNHEGFGAGAGLQELQSYDLTANLTLGYKIDGWLYLAVGYQLELRDTVSDEAGAGAFAAYTGQYQRHQLFGRLGCSY